MLIVADSVAPAQETTKTQTPPFVLNNEALRKLSEKKIAKESETVPAFPSTPSDATLVEEAPKPGAPAPAAEQQLRPQRRFAKTLRLTSDQLVRGLPYLCHGSILSN